jgi:hypothetical protein
MQPIVERAILRSYWIMTLASCSAATASPNRPAFRGVETDSWLSFQVEHVERDDLLPAFEASARSHGCSTQHLGSETSPNIGGLRESYHGISASCEEGTIALITFVGAKVRVGCAKPTTREDCDLLLRKISEGR